MPYIGLDCLACAIYIGFDCLTCAIYSSLSLSTKVLDRPLSIELSDAKVYAPLSYTHVTSHTYLTKKRDVMQLPDPGGVVPDVD